MATLSLTKITPGTTPILTAVVDGEAIQDATVYVTIDMGDWQITKSNVNGDGDMALTPVMDGDIQVGTQIDVQYSQAETLSLRTGFAEVQVGWVFDDNTADKTNIGRIRITRSLYKGVMRYGKHSS